LLVTGVPQNSIQKSVMQSSLPDTEVTAPSLSVVIPLFNEAESVELLVDRTTSVLDSHQLDYELILVDDGSTDPTWETIERLKADHARLVGIKFRRNFGQTAAMVAGFDHARGTYIATMDGDMQNDPADLPRMLQLLKKENCDIVSGWRKDRKDHFSRVLPSRIANFIISRTTGVHLHDYGCSLKIYRADCIRSIHAYGEMHRFFPALASMTGARVVEIPVNHLPRRFGTSKYGFSRIFKVFSDIFSMNLIIRFSSTPLVAFSICALPFAALSLFFAVLSIAAIAFGWMDGKPSFFMLLATLNFIAVLLLELMGILGELVVANSDLTHADLPEINKRLIRFKSCEDDTDDDQA
jgi:glycosyltransferase involved in cell wall biosynthesis